ncbi:MAG: homoserine kinase, partial [Burkholderiaceae bacterium]|nr:homoserine kinase [Burkholderiaceae bacterium]
MAVYTPLTLDEIAPRIANDFAIGDAIELKGIHGGIENSNFFLDCKSSEVNHYVLTIFERLSAEQLPYYLELMLHLSNQGISVPKPMANRAGQLWFEIKGKPAAIVTMLSGQSFSRSQPNLRSLSWWQETVPVITPHLNASQKELLLSEMQFQEAFFQSAVYQSL